MLTTRLLGLAIALPVLSIGAQSVSYPSPERQIASAVSPLPQHLQSGARVLGYSSLGKLTTLRQGSNDMVCVADNPSGKRYHAACYHRSLEPFMARGRELRTLKKSEEAIDSIRLRDVRMGRYAMPAKPAALYQYFASRDSVDAGTGGVKGAQYLYVVYMPYATYKTTGITENPLEGGPWIMNPGTPWAHLMIAPQKTAAVAIK